ncbi:MAG: 50S ribosome-binding GTPase, partial [Clostridia bacterium]|nr:50S ribosome-binding GTPase [Clostridia bacterium]
FVGEAQADLLSILAQVEAAIDYPEEVDDAVENAELAARCRALADRLNAAAQERAARLVRDGLHVALLGPPNAGKSTLLNALLGEDKAIVTDIPGTTRDVLSGAFTLDGYSVTLYDTAGIHETADQIERLGIDRTYRAAAQADAVWWLQDAAQPDQEPLPTVLTGSGLPILKVYTKSDRLQPDNPRPEDGILVSAVSGDGLDELKAALKRMFDQLPDTPLTQQRHILAAQEAAASLNEAADALDAHLSQEFAAVHLHAALDTLGQITGEQTDERLLDEIFSNFCVGK